jgi:hypothetical protein
VRGRRASSGVCLDCTVCPGNAHSVRVPLQARLALVRSSVPTLWITRLILYCSFTANIALNRSRGMVFFALLPQGILFYILPRGARMARWLVSCASLDQFL